MSSISIALRIARFARLVAHFGGGLATLAFSFHKYPEDRRRAAIQAWSLKFLSIVRVRVEHLGEPPATGMIVMNHISWLDVFVLNRLISEALGRGDRVAVFPEGTTTSGDQLLRFHAALLQPAIAGARDVHPATLQYPRCNTSARMEVARRQ